MKNELIDVLNWKCAGCEYVSGETYESLKWTDKQRPKPTLDEIKEADIEYSLYKDKYAYRVLRMKEYPPIGDQLDTIYHNGVEGWMMAIKAIKDKYPKT